MRYYMADGDTTGGSDGGDYTPTIGAVADVPALVYSQDSAAGIYVVLSIRPSDKKKFYIVPAQNSFRHLNLNLANNAIATGTISFVIPYDADDFAIDKNATEDDGSGDGGGGSDGGDGGDTGGGAETGGSDNGGGGSNGGGSAGGGGDGLSPADMVKGLCLPDNGYVRIFWGWVRAEGTTRDLTKMGRVPRDDGSGTNALVAALMEGHIDYVPEGTAFTFTVVPASGKVMLTDKTSGTREWTNRRIDDIVADCLDNAGVKKENQNIDKCDVILDNAKIPQSQDAMTFIAQTIVPRAHDALGQPFSFYMDMNGTANFVRQRRGAQTDKDETYSEKERLIRRQYVYYGDKSGVVENFTPDDNQIASLIQNSYSGTVSHMSNADGQPLEQKVAPSSGLNDRGAGEYMEDSENKTNNFKDKIDAPDTKNRTPGTATGVPAAGGSDGDAQATVANAQARQDAFTATLNVMGEGAVDLNDFVEVVYFLPSGPVQAYSGIYQTVDVVHDLYPGSWKTTFKLARQGMGSGKDDIDGHPMKTKYQGHEDD